MNRETTHPIVGENRLERSLTSHALNGYDRDERSEEGTNA